MEYILPWPHDTYFRLHGHGVTEFYTMASCTLGRKVCEQKHKISSLKILEIPVGNSSRLICIFKFIVDVQNGHGLAVALVYPARSNLVPHSFQGVSVHAHGM